MATATVAKDEVLDVLRQLHKRISTPKKWCQNDYVKNDKDSGLGFDVDKSPVCLIGGLGAVISGNPLAYDVSPLTCATLAALHAGIKKVTPTSPYAKPTVDVVGWNDAKGRKHSQVLAAIKEAMKAVKAGEVQW